MEGSQSTAALLRRLPPVIAVTFAVIGLPVLALSLIRASGAIVSTVALVALGAALSIGISTAGAAAWAAWRGSGDTLFADLMLWGWLRRWRFERRLDDAARLLGPLGERAGDRLAALSPARRVRLLKQLTAALESRHPGTQGHSRRVARHAAAIARRLGLPRDQVARIRTAAAVHDVGKVGIPAALIDKTGPLSEAELGRVKEHAAVGARMVAGLGDEELARIVRHHHERIDGRGYPDGLAGERIPLGARIVAVADTFDAVTSTRPYRPTRRHREALALLAAVAGPQLDPAAVRAFRGCYSGRRLVVFWALLLNGSRQLVASLTPGLRLGGVATAAALATVGASGVGPHSSKPRLSAAIALGASPQATSRLGDFPEPARGAAARSSVSGGRPRSHPPAAHPGAGPRGNRTAPAVRVGGHRAVPAVHVGRHGTAPAPGAAPGGSPLSTGEGSPSASPTAAPTAASVALSTGGGSSGNSRSTASSQAAAATPAKTTAARTTPASARASRAKGPPAKAAHSKAPPAASAARPAGKGKSAKAAAPPPPSTAKAHPEPPKAAPAHGP